MIRAIVFDFDGLVMDTESALIGAYGEIHARHGVPFDREQFLRSVGHADYLFDPWHAFEKRADRASLELERRNRNRELDGHLPILPGILALLNSARSAGLRLAVASNSNHGHVEGHLGRHGLLDRFEVIACREDAPSPKPEPDLYRFVLNHLGLRGSEALALEDSQTGILAAHRAGLWAVAVPNAATAHHDFSKAHLCIPSLEGVGLEELLAKVGPARAS